MKKSTRENWCQGHLTDQKLWRLLEKVDADLAERVRKQGCPECEGKLHVADYERKPRGGPEWDCRHSFCCAQEGCRRRQTPASVRFLGRRVYAGFIVVLVSAMMHGLKADRVRRIRELLGIDERTLERWRAWWLSTFAGCPFWKVERGQFMPSVCERSLPLSLCVRFDVEEVEQLVALLKFLSPITGASYPAM